VSRSAIVAIGRNEGSRLARCLESALRARVPIVYVDSGSTDGSVELARRLGATVVELDPSRPFTAGRARNEGLERALELHTDLEFVQFVDGDCELVAGWLDAAMRELDREPRIAAICGGVRERHRDETIYNTLCDLEWAASAGETRQCGGNAMMRVRAFEGVGGFRPSLIAGEEPELCLRLRQEGWRILRLHRDMVLHDADMTSFGQWWRRALRAGWAYAERASLHGLSPERHAVRENLSILFWGALLPASALAFAPPTAGISLLAFAGHLLLGARIYARGIRGGLRARDARLQALFTVLAKFPQALGQAQFAILRLAGKRRRIVDWRMARTSHAPPQP
jgi:glycosyltransferase involved in cell wall biosynthesis